MSFPGDNSPFDYPNVQPGEIYSVERSNAKIGIVKVLAVDPGIIHLRIYKNTFDHRPETINPDDLSLGSILDGGGFGVGHAPFALHTFGDWNPKLLMRDEVKPDELDGYEIWKAAHEQE